MKSLLKKNVNLKSILTWSYIYLKKTQKNTVDVNSMTGKEMRWTKAT